MRASSMAALLGPRSRPFPYQIAKTQQNRGVLQIPAESPTIADAEQRPVGPDDGGRWTRQGFLDFGSHNYIFL